MKHSLSAFTKLFFPLMLSSQLLPAQTPLAINGRLKVVNRQLTNEAGTPIQLRGMSTHGLHWFPQCYTASAVQALANNWGSDILRAAMYVDEGGYLNNKEGLRNTVNQLVDWTAQYGMYCIIDWHMLNPGDPNVHLADAKEFFAIMAQRNSGKKNVLYEICNEPNGVNWVSIKSYAEQVIPVIRQYDKEAIILVGTPSYSGSPQDVLGSPLSGTNAYNVMYTFHFYAGSHYLANFKSNLDNVLNNVPLFVTEWGTSNYTGNGGNDYTSAQDWINYMAGGNPAGIKLSWCNWNFADKDETSSALLPGACSTSSWNNTSTSGTWVKNHILNPADNFGAAAPAVVITSPANNTTVTPGSNVVITASVGNGSATSVDFYNGAVKLGTVTSAPYSWTVSNIPAGTYSFTAKATLSNGNVVTSAAVQVVAATAANKAPVVSLTAPANNAAYTAPATITLAANASDADGSISKVEFYNGSTKLGEDATAPYQFTWANVAAGSYTLTAKATDNSNAVTTSVAVNIVVSGGGNPGADLIGPDCAATNSIKTFSLNSSNLINATGFSWWVNGSTQSITSNGAGSATINFGPYFTGGQLCAGVNYSAAPWYKQYCKNITVCGAPATAARAGIAMLDNTSVTSRESVCMVFPNPTAGSYILVADKEIRQLTLTDITGRHRVQMGRQAMGQRIGFGEKLPSGMYLVRITYADQTQRTIPVLKVK